MDISIVRALIGPRNSTEKLLDLISHERNGVFIHRALFEKNCATLLSAGEEAVLALLIFRTELTAIFFIGTILLIGIVKKNGIMMVDFAVEAEPKSGVSPVEAIYQACLLRFRAIMMTTMAALPGAFPLAWEQAWAQRSAVPWVIAIVGGLVTSRMLTLSTTPVMYLSLDRLRLRLKGLRRTSNRNDLKST